MVACQQGNIQSVQMLCEHKNINFEFQDSTQRTAPYYAIQNKNKVQGQIILDKVLSHAPGLLSKPTNNDTMLILAIKKQKPQLVKILLKHGIQPNYIINDSGNTALHEALKLCKTKQTRVNRQIVKLLLEFKSDPMIKNKKGKNCYEFAEKFDLKILVQQVIEKTKINYTNKQVQKDSQIKELKVKEKQYQDQKKVQIKKYQIKSNSNIQKSQKNPSLNNKNSNNSTQNLLGNNRNKNSNINKIYKEQIINNNKQKNNIQDLMSESSQTQSQSSQNSDQSIQTSDQIYYSDQFQAQRLSLYHQPNNDKSHKKINQSSFLSELSTEIDQFSQKCTKEYIQISIKIQPFLIKISDILNNNLKFVNSNNPNLMNLNTNYSALNMPKYDLKLYGSFSTGLWLKEICQIDVLLCSREPLMPGQNEGVLERLQGLLRKENWIKIIGSNLGSNRNKSKLKIQSLKIQIFLQSQSNTKHTNKYSVKPLNSSLNCSSFVINLTLFENHHNFLTLSHHINHQITIYPQLKPLFFIIKNLTIKYKLSDHKNGGIRTYAIIMMILSFFQHQMTKQYGKRLEQYSLGQLLLKFLYFFGFQYFYGYSFGPNYNQNIKQSFGQYQNESFNQQPIMTLTIYDPLNHLNNIGKHTKAYQLQVMYKAAYIALHMNQKKKKIQFMFNINKIMQPF